MPMPIAHRLRCGGDFSSRHHHPTGEQSVVPRESQILRIFPEVKPHLSLERNRPRWRIASRRGDQLDFPSAQGPFRPLRRRVDVLIANSPTACYYFHWRVLLKRSGQFAEPIRVQAAAEIRGNNHIVCGRFDGQITAARDAGTFFLQSNESERQGFRSPKQVFVRAVLGAAIQNHEFIRQSSLVLNVVKHEPHTVTIVQNRGNHAD